MLAGDNYFSLWCDNPPHPSLKSRGHVSRVEINNPWSFYNCQNSLTMHMTTFWEILREIKKTINKSIMLLIMVGNMASIFTQVYIAKATPIYSFSPHLLHTMPFTSLPFFQPIWASSWLFSFAAVTGLMYSGASAFLFSWWKSSNQSHCNLKFKFLVCLVEVLQYRMQAFTTLVFTKHQRLCIYALTEKQPTSYFMHIWSRQSTQSCIYCTVECFVADLLGSRYDPMTCLCE